jgi:hypothetical protein
MNVPFYWVFALEMGLGFSCMTRLIGDAAASGDLVKDWTVESVEMRIGVGT